MSWIGPTGGLFYHWRAARHQDQWGNFREDLLSWLNEWKCPKHSLVLVGSSGGYTLPHSWLKQFGEIHAYDLDPLAPFWFRRRHKDLPIRFHRQDVFRKAGKLSLEPLLKILEQHPQAALLFCNVLGQVLLTVSSSEDDWRSFLILMRNALSNRIWASYHDLYSYEGRVKTDHLLDHDWREGLKRRQFVWNLTPKIRHEVEGLSLGIV
ncbi:MAG: hypothetical protein AB7F86_08670 [Bdellovibrionales bacterium]